MEVGRGGGWKQSGAGWEGSGGENRAGEVTVWHLLAQLELRERPKVDAADIIPCGSQQLCWRDGDAVQVAPARGREEERCARADVVQVQAANTGEGISWLPI